VGNVVSTEYAADFDDEIDASKGGLLDLVLFGSLDLPGEGNDHHAVISVNGEPVHDAIFDGVTGYQTKVDIPAGIIKSTGNTVEVTLTGDTGFFADLIFIDEIKLSAFTSLNNQQKQTFDFTHNEGESGYRLTNNIDQAEVYAYTSTGLLSVVSAQLNEGVVEFASLPYEASDNVNAELRYTVTSSASLPSPVISLTTGEDLHSQEADYLIVAHPSFMGDELNDFANFKSDLGYKVRIVDWLELVNTYGHGNNTPSALNNFLRSANELYSTDNILIVGGHTFDYFGITNQSVVNFIPSHYRPVDVFTYTATDNPYADLDGDNIPEIAVGRWPVRSVADLKVIVQKTKDWHQEFLRAIN